MFYYLVIFASGKIIFTYSLMSSTGLGDKEII